MNAKETFWNEQKKFIVPGEKEKTLQFAAQQWIDLAKTSVLNTGAFHVALSGGSTPNALYTILCELSEQIPWHSIHLYWSDERFVQQTSTESNFHMAMEAGLKNQPIPKEHIHLIPTDKDPQTNAIAYEKTLKKHLPPHGFDLVMLGVGEDGHTASLFPQTKALEEKHALVAANYIPSKDAWRITLTFKGIHHSKAIQIYALGHAKSRIVKEIFSLDEKKYPVQKVGTQETPAFWIMDNDAAELLE